MKTIATFTINPAIDVGYEVDRVFHTHKMRTRGEHYDPGGGGINVSRVIARLGGNVRTCYASGGAGGVALDSLLDSHQLKPVRIPISGDTRISAAVYDRESGKEYRVVPAGPLMAEEEWRACLSIVDQIECDFLVASGSLPRGVPDDFYRQMQLTAQRRGISFILDTSGPALKEALTHGGIFLVKPSQGELQQLAGRPLSGVEDITRAAAEIVALGQARYVAVTCGHEGALLAYADGICRLPAVPVEARSAVGAGDSFLAAMAYSLARGADVTEAFRYGVAAGAAAVLTPGTDLCHRSDVERLLQMVPLVEPIEFGPS